MPIPPSRSRITPMRSTLTTSLVVLLFAAGTGSAAAQDDVTARQADVANHAAAMRSLAVRNQQPTPSVRLAHEGFDWVDAGIGSGVAAALLLGAVGASALRRHPASTARVSR